MIKISTRSLATIILKLLYDCYIFDLFFVPIHLGNPKLNLQSDHNVFLLG